MFTNIPDDVRNAAANIQSQQQEEGVRLPFPVSYFRWMNGDTKQKRAGDATYFGGWAVTAEMLETQVALTGQGLLPGFEKTTLIGESEYDAYISRLIAVATICKRKRWVGSTSHVQILAYAAEYSKADQSFKPWGQVVLTAKGYSSLYIERCLDNWSSATAAARRTHANNLPAWAFYAFLGTFGNEIIVEQVGKSVKRPITPCQVYLPKDLSTIDLDYLTKRYVSNEILLIMNDLAQSAEAWRLAWQDSNANANQSENAGRNSGGHQQEPPDNFSGDEPPF